MSTSDIHEQLIASIVEDNADEVIRLLNLGIDLNKRCDEGAHFCMELSYWEIRSL